jgi:cytochrome c1
MAKHLLRSLVLGTLCSALSALAQAPAVYSVTNVATNTTLLAPGTLANVWGTGFGNDAQQVSVQIGGKPAAVIGAS